MRWSGLIAELTDTPRRGRPSLADKRRDRRLRLRFDANVTGAKGASSAVVLDLSRAGFMMHTTWPLAVGERLSVHLPEIGPVEATVAWKRLTLHGCEFDVPVSRAAISATLLKARPNRVPGQND